jgi:hypothetical protein
MRPEDIKGVAPPARGPAFAYAGTMTGSRALELLARTGFVVKGLLYLVVGTLALRVAAHAGGRFTGTRGALVTVLDQPFGRALLLAAAVGLVGYATWRIIQGVADPDGYGRGWTGIGMRIGFVGRGVVHAALGIQAWRLYRGLRGASTGTERAVAAEALDWPFGEWLLVLAGLSVIGFAVHQVYLAFQGRLEKNLDLGELRREAGTWAVGVSRFGVAARAVVLILLGWGAAAAGWFQDAAEMNSTASSLRALGAQPGGLGRFLLGFTAAGFIAYGIYQFVHARYLRIRLPR